MTTDATEAWSELVRRAGEAETWRMRFEEARGLALRAANACPEAIIRQEIAEAVARWSGSPGDSPS
jgi:hypothetical protein